MTITITAHAPFTRVHRSVADTQHATPITTYTPAAVTAAYRTVLTQLITDAFTLNQDESLWLRHELTQALAPLTNIPPRRLPMPVRRELLHHAYRDELASIDNTTATTTYRHNPHDPATLTDWVTVLTDTVTHAYALSPRVENQLHADFTRILTQLGVSANDGRRTARYLPSALRDHLSNS